MRVSQINVSKSSNGIPLWGLIPSFGKEYLLSQNTDIALQIPSGVNYALLTYSGGATVKTQLGVLSLNNSLAINDSGTATMGFFNIHSIPVSQFDTSGNQLYLHCISPNTGDRVIITFYSNAV